MLFFRNSVYVFTCQHTGRISETRSALQYFLGELKPDKSSGGILCWLNRFKKDWLIPVSRIKGDLILCNSKVFVRLQNKIVNILTYM